MSDSNIKRYSSTQCSYQCPYYQDGPVMSICNKFHEQVHYHGKAPPRITEKCKELMKEKSK